MRPRALTALALAGSLGIAACGGDGGGASTSSQREAFEDAATRFAACMRENGIDMPDPENGRLVLGGPGTKPPRREAVERAQKECQHILDAARPPEPSEADRRELEEQALRFARCMRENGIDMPDPEVEGGRVRQMFEGANPNDPRFRRAEEKCRDLLPAPGGPPGGGGSSGEVRP